MVRAIFEGVARHRQAGQEHGVAMTSGDKNRPVSSVRGEPSESELSDRMRRLDDRLGRAEAEGNPNKARIEADKAESRAAGGGSIAAAMRLSSEFVAGIVAGAILGWLVDHFLGTSPWGLIVLLMLGFVAGVMNVMRAAGMLGSGPPGKT